jgi:hypothetical protein
MKMAIVRPTQPYLKKTLHFLSHRIEAQKQLTSQLFPNSSESSSDDTLLFDDAASTKKWNDNVEQMRNLIKNNNLLPNNISVNRGIVNVFTNLVATNEQAHDLLNARKITQHYLQYVKHRIIQAPSVTAPIRQKKLLTMAPQKCTKSRLSQKEKEERNINKYLRRRLAWCNQTGQKFDASEEQYTVLPRAMADADGNPHKGNKSNWTNWIKSRYNAPETCPILSSPTWVPEVVVIDAMFTINVNPLRQHRLIEHNMHISF